MEHLRFVFFGTPALSVIVLEQLKKAGMLPSLVVTAPDKPAGRGMKIVPSPVKTWAQEHKIGTIEPETFDDTVLERLEDEDSDVFVVVAYGKILPQEVLDIPQKGVLNVHPSLLPKLRGPSPVRTAILQDEKTTGVTVMRIDEKMDHGPILVQETYVPPTWPPDARELDNYLFMRGGALLADVMPQYINGEIKLQEQEHDKATFSKLFTREDGLLDLSDDPYQNLLKIHAYAGWPGTHFFSSNGTRINVISAHLKDGALVIDQVIPEGRKKMHYEDFLQQS
mgnify:CR=1 FL=1